MPSASRPSARRHSLLIERTEAGEVDAVGDDPGPPLVDAGGKRVEEVPRLDRDRRSSGGARRGEQPVALRQLCHAAGRARAEQVTAAEGDQHGAIADGAGHDVRHHPAIHHVHQVGLRSVGRAAHSGRQIAVRPPATARAIHVQELELHTALTQAPHLVGDEGPKRGIRRAWIDVRDDQRSHGSRRLKRFGVPRDRSP